MNSLTGLLHSLIGVICVRAGLLSSEGALWKEQRRFAIQCLRRFGHSRRGAESSILREMHDLCSAFGTSSSTSTSISSTSTTYSSAPADNSLEGWCRQAVDPEAAVSRAAANVIAVLVFGARLAQEPEFAEVNALIRGQLATVDLNLPAILLGRCAHCSSSVFYGGQTNSVQSVPRD